MTLLEALCTTRVSPHGRVAVPLRTEQSESTEAIRDSRTCIGISVGPSVLLTLLMASEKWLLDCAVTYPKQLDAVLVYAVRRSDLAMLDAVVASVATAHPHAFFPQRADYFSFDRTGMTSEFQAFAMSGVFPQLRAEEKVYGMSEKRRTVYHTGSQELEAASTNLQCGPLASRVCTVSLIGTWSHGHPNQSK